MKISLLFVLFCLWASSANASTNLISPFSRTETYTFNVSMNTMFIIMPSNTSMCMLTGIHISPCGVTKFSCQLGIENDNWIITLEQSGCNGYSAFTSFTCNVICIYTENSITPPDSLTIFPTVQQSAGTKNVPVPAYIRVWVALIGCWTFVLWLSV